MKWFDVSVPLRVGHPAWPGDDPFRYEETATLAAGGIANCARMSLSVHFGTHVDAPYHFIPGGKTIDQVDPDIFIGPCIVADLTGVERLIEPAHLAGKVPEGTLRLLVKTRNSAIIHDPVFHTEFVAFSEASARWLVERGVRLLGFDYFSIAPYGEETPAHVAFLGAGGSIIENVDLSAVAPGRYQIVCLPLRIAGSGGAPARALLGTTD